MTMSKPGDPNDDAVDTHAHVRMFKLLEVAYNCARNGDYKNAAAAAQTASDYYDSVDVEAGAEAAAEDGD